MSDKDKELLMETDRLLDVAAAVLYTTEARVEHREAEIEQLRAALEPFASLILPADTPPDEIQHFGLPASYFFAAQRALKEKP